ncbi:hypothetical protein GWI33_022072 [Rhynchophorus ferrugineus]|uniref:Kinesin-like protein n=1 Tax=Rhynchophorus ferrugineus TaxID=354439 RepID=A0A834ISY3_RHYFE|nr:hypothetical protein GWI33_022072 [Rhynchophorus ferrugineus]
MSKIPQSSGLKPASKITGRPLRTIIENNSNKSKEAPACLTRLNPIFSHAMRRRSKSVTDMRQIGSKPITDFRLLKSNALKKDIQNENKLRGINKVTEKNQVKTALTKSVGTKRTATASTNNIEGPPKPKVSKKIPDWDYKGRFHQLNEKFTHVQESMKIMKDKMNEFEEIETNYDKIKIEAKELGEAKDSLKKKCEDLSTENEKLKEEVDKLQNNLNLLENNHKELQQSASTLTEKNTKLTEENAIQTKDIIRLTDSLNELTDLHTKLTKEHEELTKSHQKLVQKYQTYFEGNKQLLMSLDSANEKIKRFEEQTEQQKKDLNHFQAERRRLHNVIQDLKGNIRVFCRIRPPINSSEMNLLQCSISFVDNNGLEIRKTRESISQITGKPQEFKGDFTFDRVFPPESTQEEVFEDLAQLVQSALDGYNVCVFAYGQTGSGKTHTMQGGEGPDQRGMIPRTIDLIFETIKELNSSGWTYTVQASFLEIYNENIRDLLNINNTQKLEIYNNEGKGSTVTNLTIQPIESAVELKQYMSLAHRNRATAATNFNEHSSRSHAVTKIYIEGTLEDQNTVLRGSINLVDLAGSESAKITINDERLTETKNINKSLATLGDVISALFSKSKHIPYRNSKLTYLLQSCLGGNSKTLMVVNIAPFEECFNESINSLRFAAKVKEVKTGSKRNKMTFAQPAMKF